MRGKISPGDRVDVITTMDAGAGFSTAAVVAARNALVLAVPTGDDSGAVTRKDQVTVRVLDERIRGDRGGCRRRRGLARAAAARRRAVADPGGCQLAQHRPPAQRQGEDRRDCEVPLMANGIRVLVALDEGTDRDTVEGVLPVQAGVELVGVIEGLNASWSELSGSSIDAVLVGCSGSADSAVSLRGWRIHAVPGAGGAPAPLRLAQRTSRRRALAAGAEDLVVLPLADGEPPSPAERERVAGELHAALEKAVARRRRATAAPVVTQGRLLVVLGPKGGAGKTLVSSSLAIALAEAGERVLLLDLDLQFGDAGLTLGLPPARTIYDLVMSGGSLDAEKLADYLVPHESGARVLQAPARPDQAAAVDVGLPARAVRRAPDDRGLDRRGQLARLHTRR